MGTILKDWQDLRLAVAPSSVDPLSAGPVTALVNGTFDILHPGHVAALEFARAEADVVIVAVDDDARVERLRGRPPVMPLEDRMLMVAALAPVDYVTSHGDAPGGTLPYLILGLRPDVWCARSEPEILPFDEVDAARDVGARLVRIPRMGDWSSSAYRQRAFEARFFEIGARGT